MTEPVQVRVDGGSYDIVTVPGSAETVANEIVARVATGRLLVLSDSNVWPLHGEALCSAFRSLGREVREFSVPAGEASKSLRTLGGLWDEAFEGPLDRGDVVVAVGGGVIGDLGGFVASTLMRGIRVVQVPTTVLAMADAAIGGKTGINLDCGKNLVGTFHQPSVVVQWTGSLGTLPLRELRSGLAEVVKSAVLAGEAELATLERSASALAAGDPAAVSAAVRMAGALKADIVSRDEREGGIRRLLNFGHTLGHAIETASGYGEWTHGEAVSMGMVLALRFGISRGITRDEELARVSALLGELKLPLSAPSLRVDEWMAPIERDKKRSGESVRMILCHSIGDCRDELTPLTDVVEWLRTL